MLLSILATAALRLMTYNVLYSNPDPEASLEAIAKADPDIVLLQEVTSRWEALLVKRFAKTYPHRVFHVGSRAAGGIAVLSKVKIAESARWPAPRGTGAWFPAQRLVVESALGKVQILNVHLRPALDSGGWISGFLSTPPIRRAEIEAHWKQIDKTLPTIVAGDFNEDDISGRAIDFLTGQGLRRIATTGPRSWHYVTTKDGKATEVLALDIDHVMLDGALAGSDAHVIDVGASDHRPVVVTVTAR